MVGAGVFVVVTPAAEAAGTGLILGLAIAAAVAYFNATSAARLAAAYPRSGGTYTYGRERLGHTWGFVAGWAFVTGKLASCAAIALTFGLYTNPSLARWLGAGAVAALTAVNYLGVRKTATATKVLVGMVVAAVVTSVVAILGGGQFETARLTPIWGSGDVFDILRAGGFFFFAFAGYARIATLGEEVINPRTTIPRAVPIALGIALLLYACVTLATLGGLPANAISQSADPVARAVDAGTLDGLAWVVRAGATIACLGVLLSLLAGVGRTIFAMAEERDLPVVFASVHPKHRIPNWAGLAVGGGVTAVVLLAGVQDAIGFSSVTVLSYYAITNAAALTLSPSERTGPAWISAAGLIGCAGLALSLPLTNVVAGLAVIGIGLVYYAWARAIERKPTP